MSGLLPQLPYLFKRLQDLTGYIFSSLSAVFCFEPLLQELKRPAPLNLYRAVVANYHLFKGHISLEKLLIEILRNQLVC